MEEPKQMYMPMVFAHLAVGDIKKNTDYTKKKILYVDNLNEDEFRKRLNKTMCFVSGRIANYPTKSRQRVPVMFFDGYCCTVDASVLKYMHNYNRGTYTNNVEEIFSLDSGSLSDVKDLALKYFYNYGLKSETAKIESWKHIYYRDYGDIETPFIKAFAQTCPTAPTRIVNSITGAERYKYTKLPYIPASWIWIFGVTKDIQVREENHNIIMQLDKERLMKNTFIYDICKCKENVNNTIQPKTLDEYFTTDSSKHKVYKIGYEPFFYNVQLSNDKDPGSFYRDVIRLARYSHTFSSFTLRKRYNDIEKAMIDKYNKSIFKFSIGQRESQLEIFDTRGCGLDVNVSIHKNDDLIQNFIELSEQINSHKAIMISSAPDVDHRKIQKYIIPENLVKDSIRNNVPTEITLIRRHIHIKKWNNEVNIETTEYCGKGKKYDVDKLIELLGKFKPLIDDDYINMIVAEGLLKGNL